jgi:hypothetical protein
MMVLVFVILRRWRELATPFQVSPTKVWFRALA